jgi:hypothetical protein
MNCSGMTSEIASPDCQRLRLKLVTPEGTDKNPLMLTLFNVILILCELAALAAI